MKHLVNENLNNSVKIMDLKKSYFKNPFPLLISLYIKKLFIKPRINGNFKNHDRKQGKITILYLSLLCNRTEQSEDYKENKSNHHKPILQPVQ